MAPTQIKDGWFAENEVMWPGQRFCLKVEEVLFEGRSDFQVRSHQAQRAGTATRRSSE